MAQIANWRAGQAQNPYTFETYTEVFIQVTGPASFFIDNNRQALEAGGAIQPGLQFNQGNSNPPIHFPWIGPLWVLASQPGSVIEITPTIKPGGSSLTKAPGS